MPMLLGDGFFNLLYRQRKVQIFFSQHGAYFKLLFAAAGKKSMGRMQHPYLSRRR